MMTKAFEVPAVGSLVQDIIGHWYRILEIHAGGWRFRVDQVFELRPGQMHSYGYAPIMMGRSDFKFSR